MTKKGYERGNRIFEIDSNFEDLVSLDEKDSINSIECSIRD